MLLIITLFYFFHKTTQAAPLSTLVPDINPVDPTSLLTQCICPNQQRSIWDIIWSCFATIFACSWVSVHPNMAPPEERWWKHALLRLELMIWVLLTPELILMWAIRQWYGARELASIYKGWTKTHGYFIQMGGFMLYREGKPVKIITPRVFQSLLWNGSIEFPEVTEDQINDRSKGDGLSKAIVIGQTSWFVAQCIARQLQGLDITELELVTVAFAVLNGVMYFLWWNKPLDVRCCIPIHEVEGPPKTPVQTETFIKPNKIRLTFRGSISSRIIIAYDVFANLWGRLVSLHHNVVSNLGAQSLKALKGTILLPFIGLSAVSLRLQEMITTDQWSSSNDIYQQIPPFFAHFRIGDITARVVWLSTTTSTIAFIFGAIHCVGWHLIFPSHMESILWRAASVLITAIPLIMLLPVVLRFLGKFSRFRCKHILYRISETLMYPAIVALPVYIVGRLYLLIEALISLRNLPPGAYDVVKWTTFIPHV